MKRITYVFLSTLTAVVLLFGYHTSTSSELAGSDVSAAVAPVQGSTSSPSSGTRQTSSSAGSPPAKTSASTPTTPSSGTTTQSPDSAVVVTGDEASTQFGPVQVQLSVQSHKITHVSVVEYPNQDGRDQEINATALPILINETLTTQSAEIDMVSGATYTSQGYLTSLQSAMDKAGL